MRKLVLTFAMLFFLLFLNFQGYDQVLKKFTIQNFTTPTHSYPLQMYDVADADYLSNPGKLIIYEIIINGRTCTGIIRLDQFSQVVVNEILGDAEQRRNVKPVRILPKGTSYSIILLQIASVSNNIGHPAILKLDNATGNILSCYEFTNIPSQVEGLSNELTDIAQGSNGHYKILGEGPICYDYDPGTNIYSYTQYTDSDINAVFPVSLYNPHFVKSYHNSEGLLTGDVTFFGFASPTYSGPNPNITQGFVYKQKLNTTGTYDLLGLNSSPVAAIQINGADAGPDYNIAMMNENFEFVFESNNNLVSPNWTKYYNSPANQTMGLVFENNHGTKDAYVSGNPVHLDYFPTWIQQPFTGYGFIKIDINTGNIAGMNSYDLNTEPFFGTLKTTVRTYSYDPNHDFTALAWCKKVVNNTDQSFYFLVDNTLTPSSCTTPSNLTPTTGNFTKTPRTFIRTTSSEYTAVNILPIQITPKVITVEDLCFDVGGRNTNSVIPPNASTIVDNVKTIISSGGIHISADKKISAIAVYNNIGQVLFQQKNINSKEVYLQKNIFPANRYVFVKIFFSDNSFVTKSVLTK